VVGKGTLGGSGCSDCILGAREGEEERVPLRVDFPPSACCGALAQQALMFGDELLVALAKLPQKARGSLDVREEEGDGSTVQLGHRRLFIPLCGS